MISHDMAIAEVLDGFTGKKNEAIYYPHRVLAAIAANCLSEVFKAYGQQNLDIRLIGSLGKYASLGQNPPTLISSAHRGLKDIDILFVGSPNRWTDFRKVTKKVQGLAYPFEISACVPFTDIIPAGDRFNLLYKNIEGSVNADIFAPKQATLFDIPVITLDARTLLHLPLLYSLVMRKKDRLSSLWLARETNRKPSLPEELFGGVHEFAEMIYAFYPLDLMVCKSRYYYQQLLPAELRQKIKSGIRPVRALIRKVTGWSDLPEHYSDHIYSS